MAENNEYLRPQEYTAVDLEKISAKGKVDKQLWVGLQGKLRGDPDNVKEAIELFFDNYKSLPSEADDLICEYAQKDHSYEYRLKIATHFAEKSARFTFRFYNNILNILEKDEAPKIQELIADKLHEMKEFEKKIAQFWVASSKIFSYPLASVVQSYEAFRSFNSNLTKSLMKAYGNLFSSYYPLSTISSTVVPEKAREASSVKLVEELVKCPKGKTGWSQYQKICEKILIYLFSPPLFDPIYQSRTDRDFHIRDLILQIPTHLEGFWGYCRAKHNSIGLVVECKDYTGQVQGNDVVITSKYLDEKGVGNFGILLCRENPSPNAINKTKSLWRKSGTLIVILTDEDLIDMIKLKESKAEPEIIIEKKIFSMRISLD